jgi:hypothetical protein
MMVLTLSCRTGKCWGILWSILLQQRRRQEESSQQQKQVVSVSKFELKIFMRIRKLRTQFSVKIGGLEQSKRHVFL